MLFPRAEPIGTTGGEAAEPTLLSDVQFQVTGDTLAAALPPSVPAGFAPGLSCFDCLRLCRHSLRSELSILLWSLSSSSARQ
jgi:hypothetical protein